MNIREKRYRIPGRINSMVKLRLSPREHRLLVKSLWLQKTPQPQYGWFQKSPQNMLNALIFQRRI